MLSLVDHVLQIAVVINLLKWIFAGLDFYADV